MISTYMYHGFLITYTIAVALATEVFGYFWHRYGAHADYVPGIHDTHRIHHMRDVNSDSLDDDFIWTMLLMIMFELIMVIGVITGIIPPLLAIITITVSLAVLWWNWWIHNAYHQPNHWLESYEWFRQEKRRHYVHHYQPTRNYGIASHFIDRLMGTWLESN